MATTEKAPERAEQQARSQLESIVNMIERLEHRRDCDGEDCDLTDAEIYAGINLSYQEGDKVTEEEREEYHDEDKIHQNMDEGPLSIQVRSDWHTPSDEDSSKPSEYEILLCTGGPACRIIGDLDRGQPDTARLEYQDWFTPWKPLLPLADGEHDALLIYAQSFYFEE